MATLNLIKSRRKEEVEKRRKRILKKLGESKSVRQSQKVQYAN